jgi:hypothetical protein
MYVLLTLKKYKYKLIFIVSHTIKIEVPDTPFTQSPTPKAKDVEACPQVRDRPERPLPAALQRCAALQ